MHTDPHEPQTRKPQKGDTRHAARIAAVQALYGMEQSGRGVHETLNDFEDHWMAGETVENLPLALADKGYFRDLVKGVVREQKDIDLVIHQTLQENWSLARLDSVLRAVLRVGAYELKIRKDVPGTVVITEALDISKGFFDADVCKLVNAVLDKLKKHFRPEND